MLVCRDEKYCIELEFLASLPPEPENVEALDVGVGPGAPLDLLCRDFHLFGQPEARELIARIEEQYGVTIVGLNVRDRPGQRARRALRIERESWPRAQGMLELYWHKVIECADRGSPAHESDAA